MFSAVDNAVDVGDGVAHEVRVEVGGELGEPVAPGVADAEGLEDLQGADGQLVAGLDQRESDPVADEASQRDHRLQARDPAAGHDDSQGSAVGG